MDIKFVIADEFDLYGVGIDEDFVSKGRLILPVYSKKT